jgi:putative peptidoglycan lipid II flippase
VSTSTSYLVGCLVGHLLLRRRFGALRFGPVLRTTGWISAAAVAAAAAGLTVVLVGNSLLGVSRGSSLVELALGAVLFFGVLGLVATRLPLPEVSEILAAAHRRPS